MLLLLVLGLLSVADGSYCDIPAFGEGISYEHFYVDFNLTTSQANYVKYVGTSGGNGCRGCKWKKVPNIGYLTYESYTGSGYARGHLVPNADYGEGTYYITNCVPMLPEFNRGVWARSEEVLRKRYAGYLIYKGCDYLSVSEGDKLYVPEGCYYLVFDGTLLMDYGYLRNEGGSVEEKKLPWWVRCEHHSSSWVESLMISISVLTVAMGVGLCIFLIERSRKPVEL